MLVAMVLGFVVGGQYVSPPMHRAWTVLTGDLRGTFPGKDGRIGFAAQGLVGSISTADGQLVWSKKLKWGRGAAADESYFYVLNELDKKTDLLRFDRATGKQTTFAVLPGDSGEIAVDAKRIYVVEDGTQLEALDVKTGKRLWKKNYRPGKHGGVVLSRLTCAPECVYFGLEGAGFLCLDPATGVVRWKKFAKYGVYDVQAVVPGGVITSFDGVQRLEAKTGNAVWSDRTVSSVTPQAVIGQAFLARVEERLTAWDIKTGKVLWAGDDNSNGVMRMGSGDSLCFADSGGAYSIDIEGNLSYVKEDGSVGWKVEDDFLGKPVAGTKGRLVFSDGTRLAMYVDGPRPKLPSDPDARKALALKMVAEYGKLDPAEQKTVEELAPYSTQPLIKKYVELAKVSDKEDSLDKEDGFGMMRYELLQVIPQSLTIMCTKDDTQALFDAISAVGESSYYKAPLVAILAQRGDTGTVIPRYVKELRSNLASGKVGDGQSTRLEKVAESNNPEAVAFMIEVLKNPKAPGEWRNEAFVHLVGTGGAEGVAAVKAARAKRAPISTWETQFNEFKISDRSIVRTAKDENGATWRLVTSYVLGDDSDVFLQKQEGSGWSKPLFTGLYLGNGFRNEAPQTFRGVLVKEFLAGKWVGMLADDPEIRKDSDGDGLTDVVEARLGTDPNKADTDGDGMGDATDPCPNAAPRQLDDKEKIVAACVEARFFGHDWFSPALMQVDGMKPFELYGYGRRLLWQTDGYKGTLPEVYGSGVNLLDIRRPNSSGKDAIQISADGKTAQTLISRYSGGLNGDGYVVNLKKVGDDWFVVSMYMAYVS